MAESWSENPSYWTIHPVYLFSFLKISRKNVGAAHIGVQDHVQYDSENISWESVGAACINVQDHVEYVNRMYFMIADYVTAH